MGGFFDKSELAGKGIDGSVFMTYGDYTFSPVPLVSISKESQKTGGGVTVGTLYSLTLEGTVTPFPTGVGGIFNVDRLQDELVTAFAPSGEGRRFRVECEGETILECYPRIKTINFPAGQWVEKSDYTIELEYDLDYSDSAPWGLPTKATGIGEPLVSSADETWSIERANDAHAYDFTIYPDGSLPFSESYPPSFTVTHNVNAVGKPIIISGVVPSGGQAWEQAREYVVSKLGFDSDVVGGGTSAGICFDESSMVIGNEIRTVNWSELEGNYSVSETWTVWTSGAYASGIEITGTSDIWNAQVSSSAETSITKVSINGTITGNESGVWCPNYEVRKTKIQSAQEYLDMVAGGGSDLFWARAMHFGSGWANRDMNRVPVTRSLGHNPPQGTITYAYEFDDRPAACLTGAKTTTLNISDTNATDIFAELTVLGRTSGPVMQGMGTVTAKKREVTLDATMPVIGDPGCNCAVLDEAPKSEAETLLLTFRPDTCDPGTDYSVFKHMDTETWNPTTGKYTRQMGWTYTTCGS